MKAALIGAIEKIAKKNRDIFILTADLGYKLFDSFKAKYPGRFYDIGVAEANMISVASGLALCGKNVYCYSIVPFLIMRAYEQIRIDVAYNNLNVKLIGVGGGFTYGMEGFTHFGLEDLAIMRVLPNMTIVVAADPIEAKQLARLSVGHKGPMYIRLGRSGDSIVHEKKVKMKIGKGIIMDEGKNIAIFATGSMVYSAKQVSAILRRKGILATLINIHTIKPLDVDLIKQIALNHGTAIFTMEEHYIEGGLGSAIAEVLLENGYSGVFKRFGIEKFQHYIGQTEYLRTKYGLGPENVCNKILDLLCD